MAVACGRPSVEDGASWRDRSVTQLPPAGLHLIVDIESEVNLTNVEAIRAGLEQAAHVWPASRQRSVCRGKR